MILALLTCVGILLYINSISRLIFLVYKLPVLLL